MRDTIYLLINAILVNMDVKNVHPLLIVPHVSQLKKKKKNCFKYFLKNIYPPLEKYS